MKSDNILNCAVSRISQDKRALQSTVNVGHTVFFSVSPRYFACHSVTLSKDKLVSGLCLHFYCDIVPMTVLQLIMGISTKLGN